MNIQLFLTRTFQIQPNSFAQHDLGIFNAASLADHIQLRTQGHEHILCPADDSCKFE